VDAGEERVVAARGRPRDPERERRVLQAAIEEYSERGWAGLTMDGVAKRAGVGKSTIYLRWTNKEDLLAAAIQSMSHGLEPLDTGSLRGDLSELAERLLENYWNPIGWGMYRILVDVAGSGENVSHFTHLVNNIHRRSALAILERGVQRGEVRPDVPAQLVINTLYGTFVVYRMMAPWDEAEGVAPVPDQLVDQVVDFVLAGLAPYLTGAEGA
jgi:AcrR family transcriptional regulator